MTSIEWTHSVRDVPQDGLAVERRASAEEAAILAKVLEIPSVDQLTVTYRIAPLAGGRYGLKGRLAASVTQDCVVTLEPVAGTVEADLDIVFAAEASPAGPEIEGSLEDLERPDEEPIEHGIIDVGRIVTEELLSGLDLYPRKGDARFDWTDAKGEATSENPFAALAKLKKDDA